MIARIVPKECAVMFFIVYMRKKGKPARKGKLFICKILQSGWLFGDITFPVRFQTIVCLEMKESF